jgi:CMP-N-acetylneuraminic acid synthetase
MKAHSERIVGKNFRVFAGKPLFRWVLDSLLAVAEIGRVVINTDAQAEFEAFRDLTQDRVTFRRRREEIRGDLVSMNTIIADDIANVHADIYLMTHATNPLLRPETIRRALAVYRERVGAGRADSLFTVNRFNSRFYWSDLQPVNHDPKELMRTQDLPPLFEENSNLYVFSSASFQRTRARIGERPVLFETPRLESFDIDDEEGWQLAEIVARGTDR